MIMIDTNGTTIEHKNDDNIDANELIYGSSDHTSPLLRKLHWLPVHQRMHIKITLSAQTYHQSHTFYACSLSARNCSSNSCIKVLDFTIVKKNKKTKQNK